MPIYKMQLQHATPKNLLQKFSKSISFLMNGNSLQNLLRSIDIAQSLCLRKQKVEKWFYFITVILWMKIKMESPLCMTMKRWKIQISLIFCHDGFWTSICAWLYILMLSLWQNKPHSTSLVIFFFHFGSIPNIISFSIIWPFTTEKNWLSHTSLLKLSSLFQSYLSIVIFMIKVLDRTLYLTKSADSFILQRIHAMKLYF